MYLQQALVTQDNRTYEMAGALPGSSSYTGKLVRFGSADFSDGKSHIKGHEFHYFDSTDNGEDALLEKTSTGKKYSAMKIDKNRVMGFPHLYYNSSSEFVDEFIRVMKGEA